MMNSEAVSKIGELVKEAEAIVVVQADNPDADSLASALALEEILSEQGKKVYLYCGVDLPSYLHYIDGWSRVSRELPAKFDLSIIVDTNSETLLEQLTKLGQKGWLAAKPSIVIDQY
jgi:phosphoesterase RecJ-like protein